MKIPLTIHQLESQKVKLHQGLGQFALAPFSTFLLNHFGWKITIYIITGMSLSGILFGTLLRPPLRTEENLEAPQDNSSEKRLVS